MGIQDVRCNEGGTELADDCTSFHGNENLYHYLETVFSQSKETTTEIKQVESVSDRLSYPTLRGSWCDNVLKCSKMSWR